MKISLNIQVIYDTFLSHEIECSVCVSCLEIRNGKSFPVRRISKTMKLHNRRVASISLGNMAALAGTQTENNLGASFVGECMARMRYTYFAEAAKKEGFEQIWALFLETAENEREHAKIFFNALRRHGGTVLEVPAEVPLTGIGSTAENLRASMNGEHEESEMYPQFAAVAEKEGFKSIAKSYRMIAKVEKAHELRYKKLLEHVEGGTVFKRAKAIGWKCRQCGFPFEGLTAPKACPACFAKQSFFEPIELE